MALISLAMLMLGSIIGGCTNRQDFEKQAVARGFGEFTVPDSKFKWKEAK